MLHAVNHPIPPKFGAFAARVTIGAAAFAPLTSRPARFVFPRNWYFSARPSSGGYDVRGKSPWTQEARVSAALRPCLIQPSDQVEHLTGRHALPTCRCHRTAPPHSSTGPLRQTRLQASTCSTSPILIGRGFEAGRRAGQRRRLCPALARASANTPATMIPPNRVIVSSHVALSFFGRRGHGRIRWRAPPQALMQIKRALCRVGAARETWQVASERSAGRTKCRSDQHHTSFRQPRVPSPSASDPIGADPPRKESRT